MTTRLSEGLRNAMAQGLGFAGALNKGYINCYTGSQPATADAAHGSTLLGTFTISGGALTKETRATGTIVITAAAGGSINTVTVGTFNIIPDGAVAAVVGDTAATAAALNAAINRNGIYQSTVSGSTLTIKPRPGVGDSHNGLALTASLTTVTATYGGGTVSGGVDAANGLYLASPAAGVIAKPTGIAWSMTGIAAGTAGWCRFYSSDTADTGGAIVTLTDPLYPRLDGSAGVGSGDFRMSTLSIAIGMPVTMDTFSWTQPAA